MVARNVDKIKFIDVAQARHSSSKLDSALTKPQHSRRAGYGRKAIVIASMGEPQRGYNHQKEEYREVISLLKRGYSVRNTATLTNVSVSTVQRVKR